LICGNHAWNDCGKLHINYGVFVDMSIFLIYGAQGQELYIIVSPNIVFILYQEHAFFNPTPMLQNFGLVVRKSYLWPISQVTTKLECIRNETINNLTTRGWFVQNVSTTKEDQNDQVSTQGLPMFSRDEYNESSESLSDNEDIVASLLNFEDMHQREALPIRRSS